MRITVGYTGAADLEKKLNALGDPRMVTEMLDEGLSVMLNRIRTRFLAEQGPDGVAWKPSLAGIRRRAGKFTYRNGRKFTGTGTLFETGDLWHSIQAFSTGDESSRAIGTDIPYARFLQKGPAEGPWVFLAFGEEDMTIFEKVILNKVKETLNG